MFLLKKSEDGPKKNTTVHPTLEGKYNYVHINNLLINKNCKLIGTVILDTKVYENLKNIQGNFVCNLVNLELNRCFAITNFSKHKI